MAGIRLRLAIVPVLLFAMAACHGRMDARQPTGAGPVSDLELGEKDRGRSIAVAPGQRILIRLPEAPGTGFSWSFDPFDTGVLESVSSDYTPPAPPSVGGAGTRAWTLRAKAPGTVHLAAKQWKPWEGEKSVAQRFDLTVRVGS